MTDYFSMLFIWSKGAKIRRRILKIAMDAEINNKPCYITEIANNYNIEYANKNKSSNNSLVTVSGIRKHVKILLTYQFLNPINRGGRPEYLQLTPIGKKALAQVNALEKIV